MNNYSMAYDVFSILLVAEISMPYILFQSGTNYN